MKNILRFRNEDGKRDKKKLFKLSFILLGIASTIWFLVRVIPKPQRAAYPCMRTAAPIMSSFVIYLVTLAGSMFFFRKAYAGIKKAKYLSATVAIAICLVLVAIFSLNDAKTIYAEVFGVQWTRGILPDAPNTPMGTGFGVFPGRVAWTFSVNATNENCPNTITNAYFMAKNTNQDTINKLANKAIMLIGGKSTVKDSWDAIFKSFNKKKTGTETGYVAGQKIFIKINNGQAGWAIVASTLAETAQNGSGLGIGNAMSNTSPQAVLAFVAQLVDSCGVAQTDIIIGEPMTHIYKSMYDIIHPIYPNVILIDKENKTSLGRTTSKGWKSGVIVFSDKGKVMTSAIKDDMMQEMYDADYLINIAALKAHARGGVTFCAKNHFGSSTHNKTYSASPNHAGLVSIKDNDKMAATDYPRTDYGMYRVLTDLMGHEKLGLNTVLFVVDGLWSGIEATDMPVKWAIAPFNNDFPNSLFVAQDEIALESVCLDFLRAEADKNAAFKDRPFFPGVDDFLHQGATKANWSDSIQATGNKATAKWYKFAGYDPEGDGTLMPSSLGVHEHWNDNDNKQYSRNLFTNGTGIELVSYPSNLVATNAATANAITFIVTSNGASLQDAIVIVNGSNYLTNSEGKVVIGNMKTTTGLNYTIKKKGYVSVSGQVDVNDDVEVSKELISTDGPVNTVNDVSSGITLSVYPNPCISGCEISYQLKTSANVSLYVINLEGKIVEHVKQGQFAAGNYNEKISVENLKNGIYIGVLKTNSMIKTIKFEVKK